MRQLQIAAACLLDEHGRVLLVRKRATRAFMLPGGKLEPGESTLAGLLRELQEELHLHLDADALTPLGVFHAPAANEADTEIHAQVFIAALLHTVAPAAELEELRWHAPASADTQDLAPLLRLHVLPRLRDLTRGEA